jgi:di/tricarboxylate transporter
VAVAAGVDPMTPALGATLGASMGFMMPISTAPNAIVYSSGHVPITAMMRYGLALTGAAQLPGQVAHVDIHPPGFFAAKGCQR